MKHVVAFLLLVFSATAAAGQCAIYVADNAAWGAGFRADNDPVYTMDELRTIGMDQCKGGGGVNCHLLYSSYEGGWWGLIMGKRGDGRTIYEAVYGQSSETTARENLKTLYRKHDGIELESARLKIWHVKER